MKNFKIIEVPSEVGCAKRGACLGPAAIKLAADKMGSSFFIGKEIVRLPDRNSILSKKKKKPAYEKAKRIKYILENCQTVCNTLSDVLEDNHFPIVLSADHSSAAGVIAGIKQAYPEDRLGIIWIDAHSDLHAPYTTYSGNMHGMPLGVSLALDDEARKLLNKAPNDVPISIQRQWNHLKELGGIVPKVLPEDVVLIGVRYFKPEHSIIIKDLNIQLHSVEEVRAQGVLALTAAVNEHLKNCDRLFISFDVDSFDCDVVSKGTGTPEPNGFYLNEVVDMMYIFTNNPKVCCLEICEVNPLEDDKGNAMAEAAWEVLEAAVKGLCN